MAPCSVILVLVVDIEINIYFFWKTVIIWYNTKLINVMPYIYGAWAKLILISMHIIQELPQERSTLLFSATMTTKVQKLQRAALSNPVKIEVSQKYKTVETLRQHYMFVPARDKDSYLVYLLNEQLGNTTIIFTSTCNTTRRLALMLSNLGVQAVPIHG